MHFIRWLMLDLNTDEEVDQEKPKWLMIEEV